MKEGRKEGKKEDKPRKTRHVGSKNNYYKGKKRDLKER